jgi:division protein CdvB (Snf7/Vps24/ESCRT-III family)
MQAIQEFKESSKQSCIDSDISNLKLHSQLIQIDSILNRIQIRELYLVEQLVNAVKNNSPSGMIYAKELQQVRSLKTKVSNIRLQMKNLHFSVVAAKKHFWRQNR